MCLTVDAANVAAIPDPKERVAYKVLDKFTNPPRDFHFPCQVGYPLIFGRWMKAQGKDETDFSGNIKLRGFHVFPTLEDAKNWYLADYTSHIFKIKVRGIRATGNDAGSKVILAEEMIVHKKDLVFSFTRGTGKLGRTK